MKYFPHDSNSFDDEKISLLFIKFGYEGLGLFYTILEKIAKQEKPINSKVLKMQLKVGKKLDKCWRYMEEIGIISSNNNETFNKHLIEYCESMEIKRQLSAKRLLKHRENKEVTENETHFNEERNASNITQHNITKHIKEKEYKEKELIADQIGFNLTVDDSGVYTCQVLRKDCLEYVKENPSKYKNEMYVEFIRWFSEPNSRKIPKWYREKTKKNGSWSLAGRLATWNSNQREKSSTITKFTHPNAPGKFVM